MAILQKIDSNVTGLRYAEETSLGILPGNPTWYPLEPNSYADLGGEFTLLARNPINAGRQRQKGVTVDLDAAGGFNQDFVMSEDFIRILQGFFFADIREKDYVTAITAVVGSSSDWYAKSNSFGAARVGDLYFAKGFGIAANNGLKLVDAVSDDDTLQVSTDLEAETPPADAWVRKVGHQFASSEANINSTVGDLPALETTATKASKILTISDVASIDGETVTIGGQVYTFEATQADVGAANEVFAGANAVAAATNLAKAINGSGSGTVPTAIYGPTTVANAYVTALDNGDGTITVTAKLAGVEGNSIAIDETLTDGSWAGAATALSGGTGVDCTTLGLVPGEFIYIGGDSAPTEFVKPVNNGWARVKSVLFNKIIFDKTSGTMDDETGTSLTIQIFFGRVLKNEIGSLIKRRTYNLERTLGFPDTAQPNSPQAEYLEGAVANELTFTFQTADKLNCDLAFIAIDDTQATVSDGLKPGTRPDIVSADAFNASNDVKRLKMVILDPTNSNPTDLFAFLKEFTIKINNNASPNKAISRLGAFEVTAGQFDVDGTATAYFSQIDAIDAIRNNADVSFDMALVKANQGFFIDMPLIALGGGKLNVEQNKEIDLPLEMPAAEDRNFHHTLMMGFFPYLPDAAE